MGCWKHKSAADNRGLGAGRNLGLLKPDDQLGCEWEKRRALGLSTVKESEWPAGTSQGDLACPVRRRREWTSKKKSLVTLRSRVWWWWGGKPDWRDVKGEEGDFQSGDCFVPLMAQPSCWPQTNQTKRKGNCLRVFKESTTESRLWSRGQFIFT